MKNRTVFGAATFTLLFLLSLTSSGAADIETLRSAIASEDWPEAKRVGEAVTTEEPENGEAFYLLGKSLLSLRENEAAVKAFERAVSLVEDDADYYSDYGYALVMRGQEMNPFQAAPTYMKALDQYKRAVKLNPDQVAAHIGLARYYMNAPAIGGGSMKKAKEHAAELARINPYLGHIEYGMIAQKENRFEDAEMEFQKALSLKGDEAWLYFELAKLQQASGKMPEAKASYEKTFELNPDHQGAKAALEAF